ncbi:hypothetical protein CC86DRAFT_244628, partial [Ophiobolus disseminans]
FVSAVAQALNAAQVPCVLWGHYLLNVHGVPSIVAVNTVLPSYFVLASDQTTLPLDRLGRGCGAFPAAEYPIVAPTAVVLLEAYLRIYARDTGTRIDGYAKVMICYMEEYVEADGYLNKDDLPEPLRTLYEELKEGKKPVRQWT